MANCLQTLHYLAATVCLSYMLMDRDIHTNTLKEGAKTLNQLGF